MVFAMAASRFYYFNFTRGSPCLPLVYPLFTPCLSLVYSLFTPCLPLFYTLFIPCLFLVYPLFIPCLSLVYPLFTPCLNQVVISPIFVETFDTLMASLCKWASVILSDDDFEIKSKYYSFIIVCFDSYLGFSG